MLLFIFLPLVLVYTRDGPRKCSPARERDVLHNSARRSSPLPSGEGKKSKPGYARISCERTDFNAQASKFADDLGLTEHRKCSRHQDRVGNGRFEGTVFLAFLSRFEPFRIIRESSKLQLAFRQRFPLQNQEQVVVRLSDRDSPEPKLLDSMLLEQSQRIILKTFQQSW